MYLNHWFRWFALVCGDARKLKVRQVNFYFFVSMTGRHFTFQHELLAGRCAKPDNDPHARAHWCGAAEAVAKVLPLCTRAPAGNPPSCAAGSRLSVYAFDWSRVAAFADRLARRTERPGRLLLTRAHTHTMPPAQLSLAHKHFASQLAAGGQTLVSADSRPVPETKKYNFISCSFAVRTRRRESAIGKFRHQRVEGKRCHPKTKLKLE